MKRITLLLAVIAFVFGTVSCGGSGPVGDAKKQMKLMKAVVDVVNKATKDKNITDKEAEKIETSFKNLLDFAKEIEEKYSDDREGREELRKYFDSDEFEKISEEYGDVMEKLVSCEGYDKINMLKLL